MFVRVYYNRTNAEKDEMEKMIFFRKFYSPQYMVSIMARY